MDHPQHETLIRIGGSVLDRTRGTLLRDGEIIPVRAKTFALLTHLADNRGRVVGKDELLASIWPDVIVSEDSLTQCVCDLRKALGDDDQQWLRTVSRRGYLLADLESSPSSSVPQAAPSLSTSEAEPVVAVLPFAVAGEIDPVLIDGIIEEITNGLARFRSVTVIARSSAFAFPADARPDHETIGLKLHANYLVEGAARRRGDRYRIAVSLIRAANGQQVWGETFDCTQEELLTIDTLIAQRVIVRLVVNIEDSIIHSIAGIATGSLRAFENLMRGIQLLRTYGPNVNEQARDCFLRAIEMDPEYGLAHAYLGLAEIIVGGYGSAPQEVVEQARDRLVLALRLDPHEPRCHRIMGLIRLFLREYGAAESHVMRALSLNPYDADTLAQLGFLLTMRGRAEEGLRWIQRAIELNPFRPLWYDSDLSFAFYSLGRYQEAIDVLESTPSRGVLQNSRLAAAYAMTGNEARAAYYIGRAMDNIGESDLLVYLEKTTQLERETDTRRLLDGVKMALEFKRQGR